MTHDPGPAFRALHQSGNPFILANAWDAGSAKVLASLGAQALATTSGGHAFTLGRQDMGTISRDESLSHAADLVAATNLPAASGGATAAHAVHALPSPLGLKPASQDAPSKTLPLTLTKPMISIFRLNASKLPFPPLAPCRVTLFWLRAPMAL